MEKNEQKVNINEIYPIPENISQEKIQITEIKLWMKRDEPGHIKEIV